MRGGSSSSSLSSSASWGPVDGLLALPDALLGLISAHLSGCDVRALAACARGTRALLRPATAATGVTVAGSAAGRPA